MAVNMVKPAGCRPATMASTISGASKRHAEHPADVGRIDVLGVGDLPRWSSSRRLCSILLPSETAGEGLQKGAIDVRSRRRCCMSRRPA